MCVSIYQANDIEIIKAVSLEKKHLNSRTDKFVFCIPFLPSFITQYLN